MYHYLTDAQRTELVDFILRQEAEGADVEAPGKPSVHWVGGEVPERHWLMRARRIQVGTVSKGMFSGTQVLWDRDPAWGAPDQRYCAVPWKAEQKGWAVRMVYKLVR